MKGRKPNKPLSLMGELRRRRVLYTAVVYAISAFAVTEIAAFLFEGFGAPEWADPLLVALFVAGFPVAMYLSWAFDISTDGIVRASAGDRRSRWTTIALAMGLLVVATGGLFYLIFPEPQAPTEAGASFSEADYSFEPAEKLENSIAVLPFDNLSAEPDDAFFSIGVAEEVLNHLSSYRELNIIGRTSSFVFRDKAFPAPKICALLGVRFLLQGSVRRHEDQVRVSTQLLDEKGVQVWSRNFDRRLTDIFAIQTEIARAVAEAVAPEVTARTLQLHLANLDAYDQYLKGRDLLYHRLPGAADALERAVELDPHFASAHAELAIALAIGGPGQRRKLERARESVNTALSLQPGLPRALAARGLLLQFHGDWVSAEAALRKALAQVPNMTDALMWLAASLNQQGREEDAIELYLRALRIDPLHPTVVRNESQRLAERGEDQRAIAVVRRAIESPDTRSYHPSVILFDIYSTRGKLVEAVQLARERTEDVARNDSLDTYCYCMLVWAHSLLGDWNLTNYWLERSYRDFQDTRWTDLFKVHTLRSQGLLRDALNAANERHRRIHGQEEDFSVGAQLDIGTLEALAGDYAAAIERLAPVLESTAINSLGLDDRDARQALAWAYVKTDQSEKSETLLAELEQFYEKLEQEGKLRFQLRDVPHRYALNAILRGESEEALDRLETIVGWGWRMIYLYEQDPRWDSLRDHPRFQALVAQIKADVHRQRAELELTEPHQTFVARLDAIIAEGGERPE